MLSKKSLSSIQSSYEKSNKFLQDKSILSFNPKSRHWKEYYKSRIYDIHFLASFRDKINQGLSIGLDDAVVDFPFSAFAELVNIVGLDYVMKNLPSLNIGNSDSAIKFLDKYVDFNCLAQIAWLHDIEKYISIGNDSSIHYIACEIGGGFGSFARLILQNFQTKYISIDLPEANMLSSYYLSENFPNKKMYLFDDYIAKENPCLTIQDIQDNDIIILPPNCSFAADINIDLFINTRSMMEMDMKMIKTYFDFIHNQSKEDSLFLNINRYDKYTTGSPIKLCNYPYDADWSVLESKPSFQQPYLHFLLTKRQKPTDVINDIHAELIRISTMGKEFSSLGSKPFLRRVKSFLKKMIQSSPTYS